MSLPNVNITLGNGNIGTVTLSDDGIAGLILTGSAVEGKLALNKVYVLSSSNDLSKLGIDKESNPLVYKDVSAFYTTAGDGAELHLLVVSEATTLTQICSAEAGSPLQTLIDSAAGRIRLVGVNRNAPASYAPTIEKCIDKDVVTAIAAAQSVVKAYMAKIAPFVVLLPAIAWSGETDSLYQPRGGSQNSVSVVLASDGLYGGSKLYSAAIGQVLGRAATCAVNISIGRVKDGSIAADGYLTDGKKPEEDYNLWNILHDAGYIFYRTYIGKNGYYLNDDATAIATTDDYHRLCLIRVIQKAVVICYKTYIDEILDSIMVDADTGQLSQPVCKSFEQSIIRSINTNMDGEISGFKAYINPDQNLISTGSLKVQCKIVPTALLKEIDVDLSFSNPYNTSE
nr:MAG TPA: tail sheath protein [Caudoviricetes sp.]